MTNRPTCVAIFDAYTKFKIKAVKIIGLGDKTMDALYQLQNKHSRLHHGRHGYIEIERFDEAIGSGFAPLWVVEAICNAPMMQNKIDTSFDFEMFAIPCEDSEGNKSEPLKVTSNGVVGFGRACFEAGLPTVYRLWQIWNGRSND